jgi:phosphoglycolate phosphatase
MYYISRDAFHQFSICGDEVSEAKPSAQPLLALCKQARVSPEDCLVVGDTSADTGMGRNANAGLIVGVLTGTGTADYLFDNGADAVIPNIGYLSRLFGMKTRDRSSSDITVSTSASSSSIEGD